MHTQPLANSEEPVIPGLICPVCSQRCRAGELICPHCGAAFSQGGRTRLIEFTEITPSPISRPLYEGLVLGLKPIAFEVGGKYITLPALERIVVGRSTTADGPQPDVDLSPFAAEEKGVSRCHVRISRKASLVYVTDLGSLNGSWLNGLALSPQVAYLLRDRDRLRLGRLELQAIF